MTHWFLTQMNFDAFLRGVIFDAFIWGVIFDAFLGVIFDAFQFVHGIWRTFLGGDFWRIYLGDDFWRIFGGWFLTHFSFVHGIWRTFWWVIFGGSIEALCFLGWLTQNTFCMHFDLVCYSVYVKFKVYATCFWTSFSCLGTAFPIFKHHPSWFRTSWFRTPYNDFQHLSWFRTSILISDIYPDFEHSF